MLGPIGSLWDAVGDTPLLRIGSLSRLTGCEILGKAEFMNPGGSIKDRAAKGMIRRAEQEGVLRPGGTIVEGTAGNTGIGLGLLGRERGYRVVVTMPDNQAREKYELLEAHGRGGRAACPWCPFSNPNHFFHQARGRSPSSRAGSGPTSSRTPPTATSTTRPPGPELWEQCEGKHRRAGGLGGHRRHPLRA